MKVFISGTKFVTKSTDKKVLPKPVIEKIDELISANEEIIVGDCYGIDEFVQHYLNGVNYRNVTVYISGVRAIGRHNIGKWEEKHFLINRDCRSEYIRHIEKDFQMAQDADCGFAIWDGKSKGTFVNLVNMAVMGKKSTVYLMNEDKWIEVNSLSDLEAYRGESRVWNKDDIDYVLKKCGYTDEIPEDVIFQQDSEDICFRITDIILKAPVSLDEKEQLLWFLMTKRNLKVDIYRFVKLALSKGFKWEKIKDGIRLIADWNFKDSGWTYMFDTRSEILNAIDSTSDVYSNNLDREFILFEEWYDSNHNIVKSHEIGLFETFEELQEYIQDEKKHNDNKNIVYRVELWETDYSGKAGFNSSEYKKLNRKKKYEYFIYDGEVCWFKYEK